MQTAQRTTVPVLARATFKRSEKRGGRAVMIKAEYVEVPFEAAAAMLCDMACIRHPEGESTIRGALAALTADCQGGKSVRADAFEE